MTTPSLSDQGRAFESRLTNVSLRTQLYQLTDELSTGQVRQVVEKNHEMMRRFGYLDEKLERFVPKPKAKKAKPRR